MQKHLDIKIMQDALIAVVEVLESANPAIIDTIWNPRHPCQTLLDCCKEALEEVKPLLVDTFND